MNDLVYRVLDNKWFQLTQISEFDSKILGKIPAPIGFIFDKESVPSIPFVHAWLDDTSIRGGLFHDLLCRSDFVAANGVKVTKKIAADVYLEVMEYFGKLRQKKKDTSTFWKRIKNRASRMNEWTMRYSKYWVVRGAWGYFHKFKIMATYEELTGVLK